MLLKEKKHSKATAAAAVSSLLAATNAQGIIQYYDNTNEFSVGLGVTFGPTDWDVDEGRGGDIIVTGSGTASSLRPTTDAGIIASTGYLLIHAQDGDLNLAANSSNLVSNLPEGFTVGAIRLFKPSANIVNGSNFDSIVGFTSGVSGYFGFRFEGSAGLTSEGIKYGWAEATFYDGAQAGVTIHRWAYEDDGSPIQVGAIPEPATVTTGLGALALGAAGLRRWRKAKQAA
ncbi:hypothetical protein [Rubellicoccus peritrichatus]|uniref:PEP-CTERM protein-sorting domain-containing protein n=1 Tax=Rubellicoccus peritrichatus TaxID=3080537 RepID=A0AAQ3L6Z0_9BACT|nr:hypothetical protein [Puniceicoccus sp. CR14]WOO39807.1 hypothetical protein RZN69_14375 [Puniceicoccus sp. CR14]